METSTNKSKRSVWIFARPIRFATIFGTQFVSHGTYPFCHWGVLVSPLNFETIKSLLTDPTSSSDGEDTVLGDMWSLSLREDVGEPVDVTRPFQLSNVTEQWGLFSTECVGTTELTDEEIQEAGSTNPIK